jgi:putative transcriptional regulator
VNNSLDIADLILELRSRLGLTQEQFAARLGVTFPTVNRWENRRARPSRMAQKLIIELVRHMGEDGADLLAKYFPIP